MKRRGRLHRLFRTRLRSCRPAAWLGPDGSSPALEVAGRGEGRWQVDTGTR